MLRKDALRAMRQAAKGFDYKHQAPHFWRTVDDLVMVVNLQGSQWSQSKYINVGVMPTSWMVKSVPPHSGCWAISFRAESIPSPHEAFFIQLACDDENSIDPNDLVEPMHWVFQWQARTWDGLDSIRAAARSESNLFKWHMKVVFKDWARGALKDPTHYGCDPRYFGTP